MRRDLAWIGLLALAIIAVLWPLVGGGQVSLQHDLNVSDLHHSVLQYRVFQGRELASGHLPLWMPDVFSGVSLASQVEAGPWYVPDWVIFSALDPLPALNTTQVLHALWAGIGTFLLARALGAGGPGAVLAGLSFALCGFCISHLKFLNIHAATAWIPWAWLALERSRAGGRLALAGLAGALATQLLAGHPQVSWLTLALLGCLALVHGLMEAQPDLRGRGLALVRHVGGFAAATATAVLLAGLTLVPTWVLSQDTARSGGADYAYATASVMDPSSLLGYLVPHAKGSLYTCDWSGWGLPWEEYVYQGLVPLLAAVFAAVALRRRPQAQVPALVALGALFFALLPLTPLYRVPWALLPGLSLFRFPHRSLVLTALALALLAGLGLTAWQKAIRSDRGPRAGFMAGILLIAVTAADLGAAQRVELALDDMAPWVGPGAALEAARAEVDDPLVYGIQSLDWWGPAYDRACAEGSPQPLRDLAGSALMNWPAQHGVRSAGGYLALFPERLESTWSDFQTGRLDFYAPRPTASGDLYLPRLRKAGITHLFSVEPVEGLDEGVGGAGFAVYRVPDPAPRAYTTRAWVQARDLPSAMAQVDRDDPRPAVEGGPPAPPGGSTAWEPATVVERTSDRVVLDVSDRAGLLVLAETWDPGWRAAIDGEPAEVFVVNGTQRGVLLPPGAQRVEWRFWPRGLTAGLGASGLGLLALAGLVILGLRRRSAASVLLAPPGQRLEPPVEE